jgi:beta-glucuronidase
MEKTGNFQADIHDNGYEAKFLEKRLDHTSLLNLAGRMADGLESLDGQWNFAADWYDTCKRANWPADSVQVSGGAEESNRPLDYDWEAWERIPVPSTWNLTRRELLYFEGSGVYTRTFRYTPRSADERLILRFEGAAYRTTVFLNGVCLGTHDGASTPFNVDITRTVARENRLVVAVDARRLPTRVPMENTDWYNYGGLYRNVLLLRVPATYIKDWFVRLARSSACSKIRADVWLDGAETSATVKLSIPDLGVAAEIQAQDGVAHFTIDAEPELWSPKHPRLYEVEVSTDNDSVRDRIGFREIKTTAHDIYLNGEKIFLKGVSVHEDHILMGKTTNNETIRATIRDLKEMHGNYLRLAHYPHDARFARIADEEGILLWEEIPVYWAIAFDRTETYRDAENQLAELILRDRNRASVIVWSVGNENADTDARLTFMSELTKKVRSLDETRLVSAACLVNHEKLVIEDRLADFLDVFGVNEYYGWYDPDFSKLPQLLANSNPGKPVVVCEFGGGARLGQHGSTEDLFSLEFQENLYKKQVETLKRCPFIAGTSPWILYDFRCPRRLNRYQEGFNRKGLIDSDRSSKKPAYFVMRDFYRELTP